AEAQLWAFDHKDAFPPDDQYPLGQPVGRKAKAFGQLQWRINCTRRASQRALQELKQLKAEAQAAPTPTPPVEPDPPGLQTPTLLPTGSFTRFHVPHSQPHSQPGTNKNDGEWFRKLQSRGAEWSRKS